MANTIQFKRGTAANVSGATLAAGEPAVDLDNGKLYIGNGFGKTLINPDILAKALGANFKTYFQTDGFFTYDGGSNGNVTGTLKIALPKTWSNTMLSIKIDGYDYTTHGYFEVLLSGYNYAANPTWINPSAQILGNAPFSSVRFAHDGSKCCILLGTTATLWTYPKIYVERVAAGYNSLDGWDTGWSLSVISTETGISNVMTPTINTGTLADTANSASRLQTARTLSLTGDATGSASFDGSANAAIAATLANSGVTAGTYKSVTVDAKGRVTGGSNPTTLAGYGITDAAPKASPALTGTPTAPTASTGTNTTQLATTAFVTAAVGSATVSEAGANYIKYSNGIMICWDVSDFSGVSLGTQVGSLYRSQYTFGFDGFPVYFYSTPAVFFSSQNPGGTPFWIVSDSAPDTTNPGQFYLCGATSSGVADCVVGYVAFGRWKA